MNPGDELVHYATTRNMLAEEGAAARLRAYRDQVRAEVLTEEDADRVRLGRECLSRIEDEKAGKARWRARAEKAEEQLEVQRAKALAEAIEAARSEHLTDDTGTDEDAAYNQGVSDAVAAIGRLLEGGDSRG
jgi:sRNA-binding protein